MQNIWLKLLKQLKNYDPSKGAKVKTFIVNNKTYAMRDYCRTNMPMTMGNAQEVVNAKLRKASIIGIDGVEDLCCLGREELEVVSKKIHASKDALRGLTAAFQRPLSLSEKSSAARNSLEDELQTVEDTLSDKSNFVIESEKAEDYAKLYKHIDSLCDNQKSLLKMRFFYGMKTAQIAEKFGTTPNRVSSNLTNARKNLRKSIIRDNVDISL